MPLHSEDLDLAQLWNMVTGVAGAPAVTFSAGTISGTLAVTGATTLSSTLAVTGTSTLTGNVQASAGLSAGAAVAPLASLLDVRAAAASIGGAATSGDANGDKIALYSSYYGIGIQGGAFVLYAPDSGSTRISLRGSSASGNASNGPEYFWFYTGFASRTSEGTTFNAVGQTLTITGGFTTERFNLFGQPTITAATAQTVTNAATVTIAGAPLAAGAGPAVITNSYALWVQAGLSRLDGALTLGAGANLTTDSGTATGAAGAVTLNKQTGTITTEALTTAGAAAQTYTVTNSVCTSTARVFVTVRNGTNTTQPVYATNVTPASGSFTVDLRNGTAATALNGTLKFDFWVVL